MSIRWRLLFVLSLLLLAFFASLWALRVAEREQIDRIVADAERDTRDELGRWIDIASLPLRHFTIDYARWDATAAQLDKPDPAWLREHLEGSLQSHDLDAVWLLRRDGTAAFAAHRREIPAPPAPPNPAGLVKAANHQGRLMFFAEAAGELWQFHGSTLAPADPGTAPAGWLLAARRWDADELQRLGELSDATIALSAATDPAPTAPAGSVRASRLLRDWDGHALRLLHLTRPTPVTADLVRWDGYVANLFVAFGLLLLAALYLGVRLWVLGPLDRIGRSLARQEPAEIRPLLRHRDEFTRIARLVETSFADHAALEREVVERRATEAALRRAQDDLRHAIELRARLARDLHDTVIQSIYAAGLGLESVRTQLSADPFEAETRIRHCMASLNESIRHIRAYIADLEPDAPPRRQPFAEAVRALAATMQTLAPVDIHVQFDPGLDLPEPHELHALQIVREGISNALRHGAATRIDILLRESGRQTVLEIRDNGRGFDPAGAAGKGRGLGNLAARAREMGAAFTIESAASEGTCVAVRFPPSAPSA